MKITRQGQHKPHPTSEKRFGMSGVNELDGEDLDYESRTAFMKAQQKAWLDEQMHEKKMRQQAENHEEDAYASQTGQITRMRGMLQDDFSAKKSAMELATKNYNKVLAQNKRDHENLEKSQRKQHELSEMAEVKQRGTKIDYTTRSDAENSLIEGKFAYDNDCNATNMNELTNQRNKFENTQDKLSTLDHDRIMENYNRENR
jgi:autotransporter translocation and assembly factor TamB